ncbi:MAG: hypothetical protein MJE77_25970, partial [Proteobacteria bacterium]|nr:hypothetical protein [Pseudomonadota bacterium]
RDPEIMAGIVEKLVKAGVLTPAEGRHLAGDVFNTEFKRLRAPWVNQPLSLTLAGFPAPAMAQKGDLSVSDLAEQGRLLVPSQEIYEDTYQDPRDDDDRHRARFRRLKELGREHVAVPDREFAAWLAS